MTTLYILKTENILVVVTTLYILKTEKVVVVAVAVAVAVVVVVANNCKWRQYQINKSG